VPPLSPYVIHASTNPPLRRNANALELNGATRYILSVLNHHGKFGVFGALTAANRSLSAVLLTIPVSEISESNSLEPKYSNTYLSDFGASSAR